MKRMMSWHVVSMMCKKNYGVSSRTKTISWNRYTLHAMAATTLRERVSLMVLGLAEMRGLIPLDFRQMFEDAGVRLQAPMYQRVPAPLRVPCSALVKGRPCKNKCCGNMTMCMVHHKAAQRMAKPPPPRCTAMTAAGTQCRCNKYNSYDVCKRHAKKQNLLPEMPAECAICYDEMTAGNRTETSCGHFFHTACMQTYAITTGGLRVTRRGTHTLCGPCPMCRTPFKLKLPPLPAPVPV